MFCVFSPIEIIINSLHTLFPDIQYRLLHRSSADVFTLHIKRPVPSVVYIAGVLM